MVFRLGTDPPHRRRRLMPDLRSRLPPRVLVTVRALVSVQQQLLMAELAEASQGTPEPRARHRV